MLVPQLWILVLVAYAGLACAYLFPHDFRNTNTAYIWLAWLAFMLRTFLFQAGLFFLLVAGAAAILRRWGLLAATTPLLVVMLGQAVWSYLPKHPPAARGETLRVMSFNLLMPNRCADAVVAEVRAADADIVLLQEYAPHWQAAFEAGLGDDYPCRHQVPRDDCFGQAVFSRRPFVGRVDDGLLLGDWPLPQARFVVQLDGRDVAFYNIHLMPPKSGAYTVTQRAQFTDLLALLRAERLPTVLCGDFNFTNASAFADELERLGFVDVHVLNGRGRGTTWLNLGVARWLPGVRLDHIYISRGLTSPTSRVGVGTGSDHRPVTAEIGFAVTSGRAD